jgi:hypothetical protein
MQVSDRQGKVSVVSQLHHFARVTAGAADRAFLGHLKGLDYALPAENMAALGCTSTLHVIVANSTKYLLGLLPFLISTASLDFLYSKRWFLSSFLLCLSLLV